MQIGHTTTLFDVPISRLDLGSAVGECRAHIASGGGGYACFVNVHSLTESTRQAALRESLRGATYCFADGAPLIWLARRLGQPISGRVAGPDFMAAFLDQTRGERHGFIGGARARDGSSAPGEVIARARGLPAVTYAPPLRTFTREGALADWRAFVTRCAGDVPRIVWVGLGAPKQELWLATVRSEAPNVMFFGVGAAFDFLAGARPRAPTWMRQHGLEWLFRLVHEPRRLGPRYATSNARFVARVALDQLGMKK